jgi:uncharacterized damage-inducible protein DinB
MPRTASVSESLLVLIDEAFQGRAWHGPTLRGALRGVTATEAAWRPGRRRHNIWEVTVHAAYWKHIVRRRITGEKRGSIAFAGTNWFRRPDSGRAERTRDLERAWEDDVELLVDEHRRLREAIAALPAGAIDRRVRGRDTAAFTIRGIAAHDLYHAGQIQLLKRLRS